MPRKKNRQNKTPVVQNISDIEQQGEDEIDAMEDTKDTKEIQGKDQLCTSHFHCEFDIAF
jgi:hypothetical protein